jgi:hypothetical protein
VDQVSFYDLLFQTSGISPACALCSGPSIEFADNL